MLTKKNIAFGTVATAALATAASADFIGFDGNVSEIGEYTVIQMHAVFNEDSDIVVNLYEMQIVTQDGGGFNHSDSQAGAGGTWLPNASLDIPNYADSSIDSYGTIGYGVGADAATNGTSLDPSFLNASGGLGPYIPSGAGWYNGNPNSQQTGSAYGGGEDGLSGYAVSVGQFVFETARMSIDDNYNFFIFDGSVGYANPDVDFGGDVFTYGVPAPGALALLGLGGLASRRRRA
jgi:hypothetical protein